MMTFKEFMLSEIGEIEKTDVSGIDLEKNSLSQDRLFYWFDVDNNNYSLVFIKCPPISFGNKKLTNTAYTIEFRGPNGHSLTGTGKSSIIYTKVLLGIKAFIQKYHPEGLVFSGYDNYMSLIYDSFYKRFLSDKPERPSDQVFLKINHEDYLRKDIFEKLPEEIKQRVGDLIEKNKELENSNLNNIRMNKIEVRKNFSYAKSFVGKFFYNDRNILYCYKISNYELDCLEADHIGVSEIGIPIDKIDKYTILKNSISLQQILANPRFKVMYQNLLDSNKFSNLSKEPGRIDTVPTYGGRPGAEQWGTITV